MASGGTESGVSSVRRQSRYTAGSEGKPHSSEQEVNRQCVKWTNQEILFIDIKIPIIKF